MLPLGVRLDHLALYTAVTAGQLWIVVLTFTTQMSPRVIKTQYGQLRGLFVQLPNRHLGPIEAYLGLQYASVLGGELRFMPPTSPTEKWEGIRVVHKFRPVCPQKIPDLDKIKNTLPRGRVEHIRRLIPFLQHQAEECLNLNIYVPVRDGNASGPFPVIMFIHGESYNMGTGNAYDGSVLASYGKVIVITINYRLGALGFMSTGDSNAPGNYALMDQLAALHWVNENIGAFGGDPKQVTLMGHGHGSAMVNILILSPVAKGKNLFKRAILQSGSALSTWAVSENPKLYTRMLADQVNCSDHWGDSRGVIDCFKTKHYSDLVHPDIRAPRFFSAFGPVIDRRSVLPTTVRQLLDHPKSAFEDIDLLLGVMKNEGFNYFSQKDVESGISEQRREKILRTYVRNVYRYHRQKLYEILYHHYSNWEKASNPELIRDSAMELIGDGQVVAPVIELTKYHGFAKTRTYLYTFNYPAHADHYPRWAGGVHGEDLLYIFGASLTDGLDPFPSSYTRSERMLSEAVMCYWTNFVKSGDPNRPMAQTSIHGGRVKNRFVNLDWAPYDNTNQRYLHIGMRPTIRNHYRGTSMALWLDLIPKIHTPDDLAPKYHLLDNYANMSTFEEGTRQLDMVKIFPPPPIPPMTPPYTIHNERPSSPTNRPEHPPAVKPTKSTPVPSANGRSHASSRFPAQTLGTSAGNAPNDTSTGGAAASESGDKIHTLSLSVTVAVGCSLLFLNILIFAGMYYHKDRRRMQYLVTAREMENKASESQRLHDDACKTSSYQDSEANCASVASVPHAATPWSHNTTTHPKTAIPVFPPNPPNARTALAGHYNKVDSLRTQVSQQAAAQSLSRPGTPDSYNRENIKLKDSTSSGLSVRENHHNQTNPVTMV